MTEDKWRCRREGCEETCDSTPCKTELYLRRKRLIEEARTMLDKLGDLITVTESLDEADSIHSMMKNILDDEEIADRIWDYFVDWDKVCWLTEEFLSNIEEDEAGAIEQDGAKKFRGILSRERYVKHHAKKGEEI